SPATLALYIYTVQYRPTKGNALELGPSRALELQFAMKGIARWMITINRSNSTSASPLTSFAAATVRWTPLTWPSSYIALAAHPPWRLVATARLAPPPGLTAMYMPPRARSHPLAAHSPPLLPRSADPMPGQRLTN